MTKKVNKYCFPEVLKMFDNSLTVDGQSCRSFGKI